MTAEAGASRRIGAGQVARLAAIVALVVVLVVVWPRPSRRAAGVTPLRIDPSARPSGPVAIVGVDAGLLWSATRKAPVTIHVGNTTDHPVLAEVWWILSDVGDRRPWIHPVMRSAPVAVGLHPHAARGVDVQPPPGTLPGGRYRLSVWVHDYHLATRTWVHSDGRGVLGTIRVLDPVAHVRHQRASSRTVWIDALRPMGRLSAHGRGRVRITVGNGSPSGRRIVVWFFLAPPGTKEPWRSAEAHRSNESVTIVDAASVTTVDVTMPRLPGPGRYELSAWIHEAVTTSQVPRDGAFSTQLVSLR